MIQSLFLVAILSLFGLLGDYFLKTSGSGAKYMDIKFFVIGVVIYALSAFGWFFVMKHIKLDELGIFYSLITVIGLTSMGVLFFKETLNMYEIVGICFAIIALILLGRFA